MKRIIFITYEYPTYTPFGGIAFYYAKVAQILAEHNFEITVLSANVLDNGHGEIEQNANGRISHFYFSCNNPIEFEKVVTSWLFEQKGKFDIIEIPEQSGLFLNTVLEGLQGHLQSKLVVRVHGTTILSRLFNAESKFRKLKVRFYNKLLLNNITIRIVKMVNFEIYGTAKRNFKEYNLIKNADFVTTTSCKMAAFVNKYWLKSNQAIVFPNSSQYRIGVYEKKSFDKRAFQISYVNRLQYWKGFDLFYLLSKQFSMKGNIKFLAFGSDSQLNIGFTKNQISRTVELKGFVKTEELIDVYRNSQVIIVPSRFESFSNVALEAMGFGCILIVSDNIGMAEYITHGLNGFVFQSDKYYSLESVFTEIIGMESSALERVSFNAYQTALKLSENKELLEFYHSL